MNAVECLNVSFNRGSRTVLNNISFSVAQGEFVALIGHNGAGKSTLIKLCLGLITPEMGKVKVLGGKPGASPISALQQLPGKKSVSVPKVSARD